MEMILIRGERRHFILHSGKALGGPNKLDMFAEHLAEGYSVSDAARLVYGTATLGNPMMQRIRKRLGPQAV